MKIDIDTIEHKEQVYDTCGNYWEDDGVRFIRVSQMEDEKFEFLVVLHELIEQELCQVRGIATADIDKFDQEFTGEGEPGDAEFSPYKKEHFFSTSIERLMAAELGVEWQEYEAKINSL
jgi:hypothetical protein